MNPPPTQHESGASTPTRNVRGASPARTSSPGFDPHFSGDHHKVIRHSHRLVEIVPRSPDEWRAIDNDRRRAARKLIAREQACAAGTPTERMRHRRSKGSRRGK